jgi:hypothetical protein
MQRENVRRRGYGRSWIPRTGDWLRRAPEGARPEDPTEPGRRREAGFTIIEMVVALFVMVELILAVLLLFDFSNKLSRVQTNVADMQQSLRVSQYDTVRLLRMVGRGGLPVGTLTATGADATASATLKGIALAVRDNVPAGATVAGVSTPALVAGTDVLTVRGAFSSPLYQVLPNAASFTVNLVAGTGTIIIPATAPNNTTGITGGIPQHLDALVAAVTGNIPEALLLVSPINDTIYAVVELNPATSDVSNPAVSVTIGFRFLGGVRTAAYNALSPGGAFPAAMNSVSSVGILEEYRIYVRSFSNNPPGGGATASDQAAALNSKLSRARTFPNTDDPWGPGSTAGYVAANAPNLSLDVADDVTDLQVALGFDSDLGGGSISAGTATTLVDTGDNNDDWLFNSASDIPIGNLPIWNNGALYYIRLSTLVRTDRPDPKYTAPLVVGIEDSSYAASPFNTGKNLMFRRRLLQTVVDLRNL